MDNQKIELNTNDRIGNIIAKMSMSNNYWGYLFSRIRRFENYTLPSIMGVSYDGSGRIILNYNPLFFKDTKNEVIEKVLEHEGLHVLNKHLPRSIRLFGDIEDIKDKMNKIHIFNIAADICVNRQIDITTLTINNEEVLAQRASMYKLPDDKITEFYYYELLKKNKDENGENNENGSGNNENGENNKNENGSGNNENGENNKNENGSGNGKNIDDHSEWLNGNGESNLTSDQTTLARKIENNITKIVKESVKNFNKQRGKFPGGVEELINEILSPPKLPYYMMVKKLVTGSKFAKYKRSPSRINRKRVYTFFLNPDKHPIISPFPGKKKDVTFKIGILIDTSGSMLKEEILEGLCAIKNLFENDRHCHVTVIENDTKIQKEYEIKKLNDIEFNIKGRGGSILEEGVRRFGEINPDIVIGFTDAEIDDITKIPSKYRPKKMIWVIPENSPDYAIKGTGIIVRVN
jgi:predicted metal-dependent peptidase